MFKWLNIISIFKFYWLLNFLHCCIVATNVSIWQVLLAIECEKLPIHIFFFKGPSCVSQKTKDNKLTPHMFLENFVSFFKFGYFCKDFFLDLTKINK
jgi:hypothetical protein